MKVEYDKHHEWMNISEADLPVLRYNYGTVPMPKNVSDKFKAGDEVLLTGFDLGMNTWMSEPFEYPDKPLDRGKVLDAAKVRELGASWGRYKDVDGDGIPWRSLPGTEAPPAFIRGSGHNELAEYTERADDYVSPMAARAARLVPKAKAVIFLFMYGGPSQVELQRGFITHRWIRERSADEVELSAIGAWDVADCNHRADSEA